MLTSGKQLKTTLLESKPAEVKNLTKSMENRLPTVMENKGHPINH